MKNSKNDWRKSPHLGSADSILGKSDCEIIKDDFGDFIGSIGECMETTMDKNSTKLDVVGSIFGMGVNLLKLGFDGTVCAVKNTPKAIATVADAKRKFIDAGTKEYYKVKKESEEQALEEKIKQLRSFK